MGFNMVESWLYSPHRMKWVTRPEKKTKTCVFCKISKGKHDDMVLYKNRNFIVLMNLYPYNTGHVQVLPKKHVTALEELTDKQITEMFILTKKCVKLLKKVLSPLGFNIGINQGGNISGASIDHLHLHIVPRFRSDFGFFEVTAHSKALPERVSDTFERLKKEVKILK